jgi:hypothetical protein
MKENNLLLSKFTSEKGFELNNYLTQLFTVVRADNRDGSTHSSFAQEWSVVSVPTIIKGIS